MARSGDVKAEQIMIVSTVKLMVTIRARSLKSADFKESAVKF